MNYATIISIMKVEDIDIRIEILKIYSNWLMGYVMHQAYPGKIKLTQWYIIDAKIADTIIIENEDWIPQNTVVGNVKGK
ncbi:hypothetical protein STRDD10_00390 [Streptococcus sp. DD10]|nr:hypothetical protein STRDD10_00390 [Streptococcus sp. DD10]